MYVGETEDESSPIKAWQDTFLFVGHSGYSLKSWNAPNGITLWSVDLVWDQLCRFCASIWQQCGMKKKRAVWKYVVSTSYNSTRLRTVGGEQASNLVQFLTYSSAERLHVYPCNCLLPPALTLWRWHWGGRYGASAGHTKQGWQRDCTRPLRSPETWWSPLPSQRESHIGRMTLKSLKQQSLFPCARTEKGKLSSFPKRKMPWLCWQWHGLWSADSPASLPIPALPAMERVLINKATNAMERENKGKKREAEGAREHGGL